MEDKIFDIITDLLRDDISKTEAIEKLLNLHSVMCCPCCKCEDITDVSLYDNNNQDVVGGTYQTWKILDIRRCNKCGVIFQPIEDNA